MGIHTPALALIVVRPFWLAESIRVCPGAAFSARTSWPSTTSK
jgi:hypothetical protein